MQTIGHLRRRSVPLELELGRTEFCGLLTVIACTVAMASAGTLLASLVVVFSRTLAPLVRAASGHLLVTGMGLALCLLVIGSSVHALGRIRRTLGGPYPTPVRAIRPGRAMPSHAFSFPGTTTRLDEIPSTDSTLSRPGISL